ncbi:MAG: hypothetical protein NC349_00975 [Paenibacillus sp.]|nr:hypothetical protein [Paenibacillus sp.]
MKKHQLPISAKAYARFIARIESALSTSPAGISAMRHAFDLYLSGDTSAAEALPADLKTAFRFLRHEIDVAIERSRRARERARIRRAQSSLLPSDTTPLNDSPCDIHAGRLSRQKRAQSSASPVTTPEAVTDGADTESSDETMANIFKPSRRQRRAECRKTNRQTARKRNKRLCPMP